MYLIRDIHEATKGSLNANIRLFEGFVSFKEAGTDNRKDVSALREKVKNALQCQDSIYDPEELKLVKS